MWEALDPFFPVISEHLSIQLTLPWTVVVFRSTGIKTSKEIEWHIDSGVLFKSHKETFYCFSVPLAENRARHTWLIICVIGRQLPSQDFPKLSSSPSEYSKSLQISLSNSRSSLLLACTLQLALRAIGTGVLGAAALIDSSWQHCHIYS